jgi:glycosyltransferase involved in cell wall biosynthesis
VGPPGPHAPALATLVDELGLAERVRVLGAVDDATLAGLYRSALVLCYPTRAEGFGLPVLEAMASGTPVVTVRDEALLEVVGDAAVIVAEDGLADGIRYALEHHDELAAAGLERARLFSWQRTAERTAEVYAEALRR